MAHLIQRDCSNVTHTIYEKNGDIGGTWLEVSLRDFGAATRLRIDKTDRTRIQVSVVRPDQVMRLC